MKKAISWAAALILLPALTACGPAGLNSTAATTTAATTSTTAIVYPSQDDFVLRLEQPPSEVKVGDSLTLHAYLKNNSGYTYTVTHGPTLIWLTCNKAGTEPIQQDLAVKEPLEVDSEMEQKLEVTFNEPGDYYVRVNVDFWIGEDYTQHRYTYQLPDWTITVIP